MAIAQIGYEIVAEFVIEAAAAHVATNALTKKVQELSNTVDKAIFGAARLGAAYVKSFATGGAGVLGVLGTAIKSSEKFRATQIELANVMISNRFTGASGEVIKYAEAMAVAEQQIEKINKVSAKANISTGQLAASAKLFATFLAPKGGDFAQAVELARVSVKAGAALNIDQSSIQQQIANAVGGNLSKGTLFGTRIFAEAGDVLSKDFGINSLKQFNKVAKTDTKRAVDALTAALDKLAGGADIVKARSKLMVFRLTRIRDLFFGLNSILKPLGDQLVRIIGPVLDVFTDQLEEKGGLLVEMLNVFFKQVADTPKELFLNLRQFAALSGDIKKAANALKLFTTAMIFSNAALEISSFARSQGVGEDGGASALILTVVERIARPITKLFGRLVTGKGFGALLLSVIKIIGRLIPRFIGLIVVFQILSRGADKARIVMAQIASRIGGTLIKEMERFGRILDAILSPFNMVIDVFSDATLLGIVLNGVADIVVGSIKKINDALSFFAVIVLGIFSVLKGVGAAIGAIYGTIAQAVTEPMKFFGENKNPIMTILSNGFEAFGNEVGTSFTSGLRSLFGSTESGEKTVSPNVTKVDIDNTFNIREKIEPDRIAFTIKEQLQKYAESPRTSRGGPVLSPTF